MDGTYPLSHILKEAIVTAQNQARLNRHTTFSGAHLLWGILQEDTQFCEYLETIGKNVHNLRSWAEFKIKYYPKSSKAEDSPSGDEGIQRIFNEADRLRRIIFAEEITSQHLIEALSQPGLAYDEEELRLFPISPGEIQRLKKEQIQHEDLRASIGQSGFSIESSGFNSILVKYCEDISQRARNGKIDPVIGREKEMLELVSILGKRQSPNVLIVGEPGVGKTALIGGLALLIMEENIPSYLEGASIFELDISGRLVAGAYKGEVEERLKKILTALKEFEKDNDKKAVLFIDEIHILLDEKGSVGSGAVNLLKPELARGELTVIGATTNVEWQKFIESDPAFERRFSTIVVKEPDEELAIEMLQGISAKLYEKHQIKINEEAMPEAVYLAKRYLGKKNLPVSAIDLLDTSLAFVKVMNDTAEKQISNLGVQLEKIAQELVGTERQQAKKLERFGKTIENSLTPILLGKLSSPIETNGFHLASDYLDYYTEKLSELSDLASVTQETLGKEDVASVVSYQSGIPIGKIQTDEQQKMLNIESHLRERVVGQDHALEVLANVIRRSRVNLKEPNKPIGVFFFVGPTGTGKTELAKSLAEFLFNDESALIRFDMSEFKEKHSVALLYGSPPGYIGYKEGGLLVNKIRRRPYSVVLLDEIEKAHDSVYDIFLQILDEGAVHDKQGKRGDFSNAIVIFTSNVASDWIANKFRSGVIPNKDSIRTALQETKNFRPEFLGRRMSLIPFAPITEEVARTIFQIQLKRFSKLLQQQDIFLKLTTGAEDYLLAEGFSPEYGARPLKDAIEELLGTPLAEQMIKGQFQSGDRILIDYDEPNNKFNWTKD